MMAAVTALVGPGQAGAAKRVANAEGSWEVGDKEAEVAMQEAAKVAVTEVLLVAATMGAVQQATVSMGTAVEQEGAATEVVDVVVAKWAMLAVANMAEI